MLGDNIASYYADPEFVNIEAYASCEYDSSIESTTRGGDLATTLIDNMPNGHTTWMGRGKRNESPLDCFKRMRKESG